VLAEYDLKSLHPGRYVLQVTTKDLVRNTTLSEQTEFAVE
jgi:hypothetical protein